MEKIRWRELLQAVDTIVILMGLQNLGKIIRCLIENGCDPQRPVALVESGTITAQKKIFGSVATITDLVGEWNFRGPAVIVVGEVVRLGRELEWFHDASCGQPVSAWETAEGGSPAEFA